MTNIDISALTGNMTTLLPDLMGEIEVMAYYFIGSPFANVKQSFSVKFIGRRCECFCLCLCEVRSVQSSAFEQPLTANIV